ncbi:MAG: hypothetical protein H7330_08765 [Hymenobacteraceae bacterium]|nr:hypothetical protein [Hymenobacteraceae bacterium]
MVRSLSDVTPDPILINGQSRNTINYLDATTITLATNQITIPLPAGTPNTPYYADAYEWTIPTGWTWVTANPNRETYNTDGTKTGLFFTSFVPSAYSIQVKPNVPTTGSGAGSIKVRAVDNECGEGQGWPRLASLSQTLNFTRPRPEAQLSTPAQTIDCGRGITPNVTASLTMPLPAGYTVGYRWNPGLQTPQTPPAPLNSQVLQTFSSSLLNAATLGGVATTGNPGTARLNCTATISGPGGYTSLSQNFVVTVGTTVVQPVITPAVCRSAT